MEKDPIYLYYNVDKINLKDTMPLNNEEKINKG